MNCWGRGGIVVATVMTAAACGVQGVGSANAVRAVGAGDRVARLSIPGIEFSYPAGWRSRPYPSGVTPGPVMVIDVLTAPSGRTVTWSFAAQPRPLHGTRTMAGRSAVRLTSRPDAACLARGGTGQETIELSGTEDRGVLELVVEACLGPGAGGPSEHQLNAVLDSLHATG